MRLPALFAALALSITAAWSADPLPVVTGNTVVHDLTQRIGGPRVAATCLLQAGMDPHSYQPVPEDVKRLANARLVIINGLGFEGWFEGLAKEAKFKGTVVVASAGITPLTMEDDHEGHGHGKHDHAKHDHAKHDHAKHDHGKKDDHAQEAKGHAEVADPHAYNAILNGVRYAENIRDALISADPAGASEYRQASDQVIADLRAADAWARQQFAAIPRAQRKIVTNHDALQYFCKDYGFEVLAPNTALEDSQPSAKDLAELVTFIRSQQVKGIFLEFGKNQKVVEQVAREAGVKIGGELYLDGVGAPGSPAATYVGMFRTNVQTILDALR
jgi:zinc/manganese transport system substrate-binding protein